MKRQPALGLLISLVSFFTLVSAGAGLLRQDGGSSFNYQTLHGEMVELYGRGLYRGETVFAATAQMGADAVMLLLALPLLFISHLLYRRGSLRGGLLQVGVLAYFLYYGASRALGTSYNNLFLVYIVLFSACFYAFLLAFSAYDLPALPAQLSPGVPRRGWAVFMMVVGLATAFIWLSDAASALLENRVPEALGPHTTVVTYALDLGVIAPAALIAGTLLLRRAPLGYLLSIALSVMLALIGAMVIGQTVYQLNAGIVFSPGVLIGMVGSWIVLGSLAVWFCAAFLLKVKDSTTAQKQNHSAFA